MKSTGTWVLGPRSHSPARVLGEVKTPSVAGCAGACARRERTVRGFEQHISEINEPLTDLVNHIEISPDPQLPSTTGQGYEPNLSRPHQQSTQTLPAMQIYFDE